MNMHLCLAAWLPLLVAITGCASQDESHPRAGTYRLPNGREYAHEVTRRCCPANWDEGHYCVFGTNGWMCIEYYPDGLPCRESKGAGVDGPRRNVTQEEREFDFFGKELPHQADDSFEMRGSGSYVRCLSRVYSGASVRSKEYFFDMYYFAQTDTCVMVGAWAVDSKNGVMDKLVFSIDASRGVSASVMDVHCHAGELISISNTKYREDGTIDIEFDVQVDGRTIRVSGCVNPSRGRR